MLFTDRVRVVFKRETDETDAHGNPITEDVDVTVPGEVWPLGSDKAVDNWPASKSRYRVALAAVVDIPPYVDLRLEWGPYPIRGALSGGMNADGAVERFYVRGRLHHYEITTALIE